MSTLTVVEEILREANQPLSVREIVERAGAALPTKSKTPDTVVARDLSMDIKKKAEASLFIRTSPGRYTLRSMVAAQAPATTPVVATVVPPVPMAATPPSPATMLSSTLGERAGTRPAPAPTAQAAQATAKPNTTLSA